MDPLDLESTRSLAGSFGHPVWGWEIPVYLFLGGLAAGLTVAISAQLARGGVERITRGMRTGLVLAPLCVSLGMVALFLDLGMKSHVFRFYTTFRPASPMSWGAFILLVIYPVHALLVLALPPAWLEPLCARLPALVRVGAFARRHVASLARLGLAAGGALGLYTGILLAATVARPLWSSAVLGPLFLASGLSTGLALLMMLELDDAAQRLLARADVMVLAIELGLLFLWLSSLSLGAPLERAAAAQLLAGPYAPAFLGFVVFGGLLVPGALEALALRGRAQHTRLVPLLVLAAGFVLRVVVVAAGQRVGFVSV